MVNALIKPVFVLALIINGALLSFAIGRFFLAGKTGFEAMEELFAWQLGGAVVGLAAGLIVAIQFQGDQLRRWALVLVLTATGLIVIPIVQQYTGGAGELDRQLDTTLPKRSESNSVDTEQNS